MSDITDEDLESWLRTDIDPQLIQALAEIKRRRAEQVSGAKEVHRVVMEACSAFLDELGDRDQTTLQSLDEVNWHNLGVDIANYCATEFTTVPEPSAVAIPADLIEDVASAIDRRADWYRSDTGHSADGVAVLQRDADRLDDIAAVVRKLAGGAQLAAPSLSTTDANLLSYLLGWCNASIGSIDVERDRFGKAVAALERLLGASK